MSSTNLEHLYTYGDIYETLDACQELESMLGRLRRQSLISEQEWARSRQSVDEIRDRLESRLDLAS